MENNNQNIDNVENKIEAFKSKKIMNKGIILAVAVALVIVVAVAFVAPKVFASSPLDKVKAAINNTFEALGNSNERIEGSVNFGNLINKDKNMQTEVYFELNKFDVPFFQTLQEGNDLYSNFSEFLGYGIGIKSQLAKGYEEGNIFLSLYKDKVDFLDGRMYFNKDIFAVEAKKLFKDILGIKTDEISDIEGESLIKYYFKNYELSQELKVVAEELYEKYKKTFENLLDFQNESGRYVATVNSEDFIKLVKDYFIEYISSDAMREYIENNSKMFGGEQDDFIENYLTMKDNLPEEIDKIFENMQIEDIRVIVDVEDKFAKLIDVKTKVTVHETTYDVNINMDYEDTNDYRKLDVSIELDGGIDKIAIIFDAKYNKLQDATAEINFDIVLPENRELEELGVTGRFYGKILSEMNKDKTYSSSIILNLGGIEIIASSSGKHSEKRVDINDAEIRVSIVGMPAVDIGLTGYIELKNIDKIEAIDKNNIKYTKDLDEEYITKLQQEIFTNLSVILNEIGLPLGLGDL